MPSAMVYRICLLYTSGGLSNVMRADAPDADRALSVDRALGNAAAARDGQFRVPSILGGGER